MNIREALSKPVSEEVSVICVMVKTERSPKKNGELYLELTLTDKLSTIVVPVWDDWEKYEIDTPVVVRLVGVIGLYREEPQIKFKAMYKQQNFSIDDFLPKYDIPERATRDFEEIVRGMKQPYRKIVEDMTGVNGNNEELFQKFLRFPAAVKHHGNKIGGGFLHIYGVMKICMYAISNYQESPFFDYAAANGSEEVINADRLILKAILHDIGKMEEYNYDSFITRKEIMFDHRAIGFSMFRACNEKNGNIVSESDSNDIAYAILNHHGGYGSGTYPLKNIEDKILHNADCIDSIAVSHIENNKYSD